MQGVTPIETPSGRCVLCGGPIDGGGGNVCALCLFSAGIDGEHARLGEYRLLERLGEGGMGEVWLALHEHDGFRAVKRAKPAIRKDAALNAVFAQELENAGRLNHPNIVRSFPSAESGGERFLVMDLLDGGSLADRQNRPRGALAIWELTLKLARAVAAAHAVPLLHCDIKPENVMFRSADEKEPRREPYLIDFGIAQRVTRSASRRSGSIHAYTPGWASPEQVADGPLSVHTDVWSLGVMLYWLLSEGKLPFGEGEGFVRRLATESPPRLAVHRWGLARDLAAIARRALEKDPEDRYPSVAALVADLEQARTGGRMSGDSKGRGALRLVARHPYLVACVGVLAPLLVHLGRVPVTFPDELRQTIREQNEYAARAQAGAMTNELRSRAERALAAARDEGVVRLVQRVRIGEPPPALGAHADGFDLVLVLDTRGMVRARWPYFSEALFAPNSPCHRSFAFRDYFLGQERLGRSGQRGVHVSRAFRSCLDGDLYFGFSAPLYDGTGAYVGAVVATTKVRPNLGSVQMGCGSAGGCITALLGARDRDHPEDPLPETIEVLAQPGLNEGQGKPIEPTLSRAVCAKLGCTPKPSRELTDPPGQRALSLDDYVDPLSKERSLAAFAPVASTGLVAVVAIHQRSLDELVNRVKARLFDFTRPRLELTGGLFLALVALIKLFLPARRGE